MHSDIFWHKAVPLSLHAEIKSCIILQFFIRSSFKKAHICGTLDHDRGLYNAAKEKVQHSFIYTMKTRWINTTTETLWSCITTGIFDYTVHVILLPAIQGATFQPLREASSAQSTQCALLL